MCLYADHLLTCGQECCTSDYIRNPITVSNGIPDYIELLFLCTFICMYSLQIMMREVPIPSVLLSVHYYSCSLQNRGTKLVTCQTTLVNIIRFLNRRCYPFVRKVMRHVENNEAGQKYYIRDIYSTLVCFSLDWAFFFPDRLLGVLEHHSRSSFFMFHDHVVTLLLHAVAPGFNFL